MEGCKTQSRGRMDRLLLSFNRSGKLETALEIFLLAVLPLLEGLVDTCRRVGDTNWRQVQGCLVVRFLNMNIISLASKLPQSGRLFISHQPTLAHPLTSAPAGYLLLLQLPRRVGSCPRPPCSRPLAIASPILAALRCTTSASQSSVEARETGMTMNDSILWVSR